MVGGPKRPEHADAIVISFSGPGPEGREEMRIIQFVGDEGLVGLLGVVEEGESAFERATLSSGSKAIPGARNSGGTHDATSSS
jgi:hypothetical protein